MNLIGSIYKNTGEELMSFISINLDKFERIEFSGEHILVENLDRTESVPVKDLLKFYRRQNG